MRNLVVLLSVLSLGLLMPVGVQAQGPSVPGLLAQADTEVKEKTKKKKSKRECRRVRVTGSRVKERVCRTPEEWGRIDDSVRDNVDRAFEGSTRATTGGDN